MLTGYALPEIQAHVHQDGAKSQTARETMDLLRNHFHEHLISRFATVNWPPRSCDITPLDYFLWGYVKSEVLENKAATIDALEANITRVIREMPVAVLERVAQNWTFRMDHLRRSHDQHLHDIIFKH